MDTTQIYTHVGNRQLEDAVKRNPLAKKKKATALFDDDEDED